MSEERTHNSPDGRSFEDRVFARFDALDARLTNVESQLGDVRARLEQRAYDSKPIWERALAAIQAVAEKVDAVERELNVLGRDMITLRADQTRVEDRMDKLESKPAR